MIEILDIWKSFGKPVLKGVSLEAGEGEVHAIVGPNGAGKTTLFRIIVGLLKPDKGEVRVLGKEPEEVKVEIGYLGEEHGFRKDKKVSEELFSFCMLKLEDSALCKEEVDRVLKLVGLEDRRGDKVGRLSQGMRQRLGVARSLMGDPKVLVWDEPFRGVDVANKERLMEFVRNEIKGKTLLFSTHTVEDVERFANRVTILVNGEVKLSVELNELRANSFVGIVILKEGEVRSCKVLRRDGVRFEVICDEEEMQKLLEEISGRAVRVCVGPSLEWYLSEVM